MVSYGISITDAATPFLTKLERMLTDRSYLKPVGEAGKRVLVDHFATLQGDESKHGSSARLGARKSGLYADFARATLWEETSDGISLVVNHVAARQRYLGGLIRPTNVKFLTLSANAIAYGHRAADFGSSIKFMFAPDPESGKWRPALVAPEAVTKPVGKARKDGTRRQKVIRPSGIYFWLVRQAQQDPDPDVLPTDDELTQGMTDALGSWIERIQAGDANG